jgi:hypothetical protein
METKPSEIDRWGTVGPIGCISIANINAASSGFDLCQKGHHAIAILSAVHCGVSQAAVTLPLKERRIKLSIRYTICVDKP